MTTITDTATVQVTSQTLEQDLTGTDNLGAKFTLPLPVWLGVQSSVNAGWDFKYYQTRNLITNLSVVQLFGTNDSGPVEVPTCRPPSSPWLRMARIPWSICLFH